MELALAMDGQPGSGEATGGGELAGLLELARSGDLEAFERIILRHERRVYSIARRLLGHPEDAQDAAQEVFLRLYRHLGQFDPSRSFAAWLCRMTVNVCRDIGRKKARQRAAAPEAALGPGAADPHEQASRAEQSRLLQAAICRLPEKERAALVLRDLEGFPTHEVARILGSSEVTVRSQVSTARLKIRRFLGGQS